MSGNKGKGKAWVWLAENVGHKGSDCLMWPFSRDSHGYGHLGLNGKPRKAYRLMCILAHGEAPTCSHHASHNCGKGHLGCVNPNHLAWKTPSENQKDRALHGTKNDGMGRYGRKTTPAQVTEIVALKGKMPITAIAEKYGIKRGTVDYWHRKARQESMFISD